jgi:hypothetical protein
MSAAADKNSSGRRLQDRVGRAHPVSCTRDFIFKLLLEARGKTDDQAPQKLNGRSPVGHNRPANKLGICASDPSHLCSSYSSSG